MTNPVLPVAKAVATQAAHPHHANVAHEAWDSVVGGFDWLKSVIFGEFADDRPLSAVVADMLVSFLPGVVIVTSARDAVAVILRMAQHPEKRKEPMEWVLLCACLIVIALPLAMAAAGLAAAGVGAVVGGIAGTELGAALRAVMLLLIKEASKLVELLEFLQKFIAGDVMKFLRAIEFARFEKPLLQALEKITGKLIEMVQALKGKLLKLPSIEYTRHLIAQLSEWEAKFYAVQEEAIKQVPAALTELQARLAKVLAQSVPKETHTVASGVKAEKVAAVVPKEQRVSDVAGRVLRDEKPVAPAVTGERKVGTSRSGNAEPGHGEPLKQRPEGQRSPPEAPNTKKRSVRDGAPSADRFGYVVKNLPEDLVADSRGVYGYLPVEGSQFAPPKWPVDWTNPEQVAAARNVRLDYHQGLANEASWVAEMRATGASDEDIARQIVDMRNKTRMSKYSEDQLPVLFERNLQTYGNPYGPTYDSLLAKYGNPQGVIAAGTRSNPTMDILTGIAKVGP